MRVPLCVLVVAVVMTAGVGCSSSGPSSPATSATDAGNDTASSDGVPSTDGPADARSTDAPPLSADCQRLYNCCVGAAAQTPSFCDGLVAQNICDVWLQAYAMAGMSCS